MPKILFISDHRINRSPSQRYRYEQYLNYFREQGFELTFSEIITEKDDLIFYQPGHFMQKIYITIKSIAIRLKDLYRAKQFDLIFIQREALFIGSAYFEKRFFKSGSKVVFDFDDSIWLMDTSPGNKKLEFLKNPDKTHQNILHAHAVIAGNAYLAKYASQYNKNTHVIPTTIDTNFHIPKPDLRAKDIVVIGWSGSISTIKHFEHALSFLKPLKEKYGQRIEIRVIGDPKYKLKELNIQGQSWSPKTEVDDLNRFDIGIMPLPDNEWAKGKCGLKGLSYMACGIATIMSPVGVNTEIIQHGVNGYLASTPEEWVRCISDLIENPSLRQKMGQAARQTVIDKYSVEANKGHYLSIFNSLLK